MKKTATFSRWATRSRGPYLGWLGLASHEFFHTWNVKRLRPVELGPFDYNDEVYTRSLWIAEGITDYYADLALHRAGLMSQAEFLDALSNPIEEVQTTPGRFVGDSRRQVEHCAKLAQVTSRDDGPAGAELSSVLGAYPDATSLFGEQRCHPRRCFDAAAVVDDVGRQSVR